MKQVLNRIFVYIIEQFLSINVLLKEITLLEDILNLLPCHVVQINCRCWCDMASHSECLRDLNYIG